MAKFNAYDLDYADPRRGRACLYQQIADLVTNAYKAAGRPMDTLVRNNGDPDEDATAQDLVDSIMAFAQDSDYLTDHDNVHDYLVDLNASLATGKAVDMR